MGVGCFFFFFKQKTAYELRISDWSSDVCSSDLPGDQAGRDHAAGGQRIRRWRRGERVRIDVASGVERGDERLLASLCIGIVDGIEQIGSASCRGRVGQYV